MPVNDVSRMLRVFEENISVREARVRGERLQLLFDVAASDGMDSALKRYGGELSERDQAALKSLTKDELKTMFEVREKIGNIEPFADNTNNVF